MTTRKRTFEQQQTQIASLEEEACHLKNEIDRLGSIIDVNYIEIASCRLEIEEREKKIAEAQKAQAAAVKEVESYKRLLIDSRANEEELRQEYSEQTKRMNDMINTKKK